MILKNRLFSWHLKQQNLGNRKTFIHKIHLKTLELAQDSGMGHF
jgi:hypothetical protein